MTNRYSNCVTYWSCNFLDPNMALETQNKLNELTADDAMKAINFMLEDQNRDMLDQATLQLFEAFRNMEFIVQGERVPISNYLVAGQ